jgi:hypothetical protein
MDIRRDPAPRAAVHSAKNSGCRAFLEYDEEGEPTHEALLLFEIGQNWWVIYTPDGDMYEEQLAVPPLRSLRIGDGRLLPAGLGVHHHRPVYKFTGPNTPVGAEFRRLLAEAETYGRDIRGALLGVLAVAAPPVGCMTADEISARRWFVVDGCSALGQWSEVGSRMISSGFAFADRAVYKNDDGEAVVLIGFLVAEAEVRLAALRASGVVTPRLEEQRLANRVAELEAIVESRNLANGSGSEDARTLAVKRGANGTRFRTWREAVDDFRVAVFSESDWLLEGPRTATWYATELGKTGMGPLARHFAWKQECRLNDDDHLNTSHETLSELFEYMGTIDQCDVPNLVAGEALARNLQFIEHEVQKKLDAKRVGAVDSEWFLGRPRRTANCLIAPELIDFVAAKSSKKYAIVKEQRKAEEERKLLRGGKT